MKIKHLVIAGGSGLIGDALVNHFKGQADRITILTRFPKTSFSGVHEVFWDIASEKVGEMETPPDVIINLAGANIGEKRWTSKRKKVLLQSRVASINTLSRWIKTHNFKVDYFITASAVGYYGDRRCDKIDENEKSGAGFLAEICKQWEAAVASIDSNLVSHVAILRFGIVLSKDSALISKMVPLSFIGMYPYFGDGEQCVSWIHIHDVVHAVSHVMKTNNRFQVYNVTSPFAISHKQFIKEIAVLKNRYFFTFSIPSWVIKMMVWEQFELILFGQNAIPKKLIEEGFTFEFNHIHAALKDVI